MALLAVMLAFDNGAPTYAQSPTWTAEPEMSEQPDEGDAFQSPTPWPTPTFRFDDEDLNVRYGDDWLDLGSEQFFMLIATVGGIAVALAFGPLWGVGVATVIIGIGVIRTDGIPVMLIVIAFMGALSFVGLYWWTRQGR